MLTFAVKNRENDVFGEGEDAVIIQLSSWTDSAGDLGANDFAGVQQIDLRVQLAA